jgi:hypothetical protein
MAITLEEQKIVGGKQEVKISPELNGLLKPYEGTKTYENLMGRLTDGRGYSGLKEKEGVWDIKGDGSQFSKTLEKSYKIESSIAAGFGNDIISAQYGNKKKDSNYIVFVIDGKQEKEKNEMLAVVPRKIEEKQKGKQDATTSVYFEAGTQQFSFKFKTEEEKEQFKFEKESLRKQFKSGEITREQFQAGEAYLIASGVLNCENVFVASKKEAPKQKGLDLTVPDVELARFELTQKERRDLFKEYSQLAENYFALHKKKTERNV